MNGKAGHVRKRIARNRTDAISERYFRKRLRSEGSGWKRKLHEAHVRLTAARRDPSPERPG